MSRDDYWNNFVKSGSVEDYLKFAGCRKQDEPEQEAAVGEVKEHAGFYYDNRNGFEGRACGGV